MTTGEIAFYLVGAILTGWLFCTQFGFGPETPKWFRATITIGTFILWPLALVLLVLSAIDGIGRMQR